MQHVIENRGRQHLIVEDLAPIGEALVARRQTAAFIATDEQPEEETGLFPRQREVPQLIEHHELRVRELLERPFEPVFMPGADQPRHQGLEGQTTAGSFASFWSVLASSRRPEFRQTGPRALPFLSLFREHLFHL